jgi:putative ABC transport system substrate-binding protein
MNRRSFIAALGGAAAWPLVAHAQARGKRPLVAFLMTGPAPSAAPYLAAFTQGMGDLGWVEGRDYEVIYRFSASDVARMPLLADELVRLEPGAVVTSSNAETIAIERATHTVPIVGTTIADPIRLGIAASYSRPGGNTTGIMITVDDLPTKLLELALEVVPDCRNIGTLASTAGQAMHFQRGNEATAAARLTIAPVPIAVNGPEELETAFETFAREKVQAVVVYIDPLLFVHRRQIFELAMMRKLPTICGSSSYVEDGGLISYGINLLNNFYRAAAFVDRILKGAKPADLPIEFPTKLELVINLKTAMALGLTIPPILLARADKVIE